MNWLNRLINKPKVEPPKATEAIDLHEGVEPQEEIESPKAIEEIEKPKKINRNYVLTDEERVEVCRRWANYEPKMSIVRWVEKERGKKISLSAISHMLRSEKWIPLIEQQRNQFIQGLVEEPLANKRKRIQYLQHYMERAEEKGNFQISINAIDKARLEMEPRNDNFQVQLNQFNMISDEELTEIRNRLEEKLKMKGVANASRK